MNDTKTKQSVQVKCIKSEYGITVGKVYKQVDRYEVFKGYWVRTIVNNQGMPQNYEDHYFEEI
jgi:hypothetical protein